MDKETFVRLIDERADSLYRVAWAILGNNADAADALHVEMVVAVYTPEKPVYLLDAFDEEAIRQKWDECYYVIVDGDGMVFYDEEEQRLFHGMPGSVLDYEGQGLFRSDMKVTFDLDLKAARAAVRRPELPVPVTIK